VKFGINLAFVRADHREAVARKAEEVGIESVWMPDHLVLPLETASTYPYSADGRAPLPPHTPVMDPLMTLAYLAGATSTVRFGIAVYILPLRNLIVTARNLVTLDVISRGRLLFGTGVGWMREEYDIAGADWEHRGAVMDEYVRALRVLWTDEEPEFHGEHLDFGPLYFDPKPVHPGGPPIIIGGESLPALRRAATLGDGWIGVGHTPESAAEMVSRIDELRARAGRADEPFEVTVNGRVTSVADAERYEAAGVQRVVVTPWSTPREASEKLEEFGERVISRLPTAE
jgi:probable F420-dependent oxidoreductase